MASLGFGGEESAGASFLELGGKTWTTDKDGLIMDLLASEITARTAKTPSEHYRELEARFGTYYYARIDSEADRPEGQAQGIVALGCDGDRAGGRPDHAHLYECAG